VSTVLLGAHFLTQWFVAQAAGVGRAVASRLPRAAGGSPARRYPGRATLGSILLEREVITDAQLQAAIEQQRRVLIDMGATTQDAVLGALSVQLGMPAMRINAYTVETDALCALPEKVARKHAAFPVQKVGALLTVALAVPADLETIDDLRFASGCEIRTVVALEDEIALAMDRYYQADGIPHHLEVMTEQVIVEPPLVDRCDPQRNDRRQSGYGRRATDLTESEPDVPTPPGVAHLFPGGPPVHLPRGTGCQDCRGTGSRGRVAIHELVTMNEELRHMILERAPEHLMLEAARRAGTVTLRDECLTRVIDGETTLEEVVRLTQER
jgi:type II secretory ATPase GspE/PulE/Tfp pilus assembly ATPase PilB-like protein